MTDHDDLLHLDFPTEMPIDVMLLGERVADLVANAPQDVKVRIAPHFRPGNTTVHFLPGKDVVEIRMGPEPIGTIHYAALIPDDDSPGE